MGIKDRLSGAISGSSSKRLLIVAGVVIVGGVAWFVFNGNPEPATLSDVRNIPATRETVQGQQPVSDAMDNELAVDDQKRLDEAVNSGASAIPTIRAVGQEDVNLADVVPDEEQTVPKRPAVPVIQRPVVTPTPLPTPVQVKERAIEQPTIDLAESMGKIALPIYPAAVVNYYSDGLPEAEPAPQQSAAQAPAGAASKIKLPLPGTILYAEMLSEANSDSPGPVLAQIVQGDLAGARLVGSFSTTRDKLVISFSSLTLGTSRNGEVIDETIPIQAFAVDSANIGSGVATDVDYHLLENIGITFAAAFTQGFGQAIAQSGQQVIHDGDGGTTVINPTLNTQQQLAIAAGTATGAAGESLSELFGNRPTTVKVRAGTGIGVLFLPSGSN